MVPSTGELQLMETASAKGAGIFGCDEYAILSDVLMSVGQRPYAVATQVVNSSLKCQRGGDYNTVLNSAIFVLAWKLVFRDGRFQRNDWTAKVDPDAVFLPDRLRANVLRNAVFIPRVSYLNNCRIGLHGPLEVISTGGMLAFMDGIEICLQEGVADFERFGEDVFLRQCLDRLGVAKVEDYGLLSEINCFENPSPCTSGKVAFHPFKSPQAYLGCLAQAKESQGVPSPW